MNVQSRRNAGAMALQIDTPQHCRTQKYGREESPVRGYEIIAISTFINFHQGTLYSYYEYIHGAGLFRGLRRLREIDSIASRSSEIFLSREHSSNTRDGSPYSGRIVNVK